MKFLFPYITHVFNTCYLCILDKLQHAFLIFFVTYINNNSHINLLTNMQGHTL